MSLLSIYYHVQSSDLAFIAILDHHRLYNYDYCYHIYRLRALGSALLLYNRHVLGRQVSGGAGSKAGWFPAV